MTLADVRPALDTTLQVVSKYYGLGSVGFEPSFGSQNLRKKRCGAADFLARRLPM